jgi:1-deoxy-D-xylulose-5-phosphate reductoisomerase
MNLFILGVTGSIGEQTLDIVRKNKELYKVISVSCNRNISKLHEIIVEFKPLYVSIGKSEDMSALEKQYPDVEFGYGKEGLIKAATYEISGDNLVVNGVVGSVGLEPTIHAITAGRNIALANKETLVIGGEIIKPLLKEYNVNLIPIDSEHSAIFQLVEGHEENIENIIITASGGSFRDKTREELVGVTVKEALSHPNWNMGAKITIDSATMMNKGLEVIEAHYLFDVEYDHIKTILHKESVVHSMVELNDSTILAHIGHPDMRVPINYALSYPKRIPFEGKRLSLSELGSIHFEELSYERFPMLQMAIEAGRKKGLYPCTMNAANEAAVRMFLEGKITFLEIEEIVEHCLIHFEDDVLDLDHLIQRDIEVKEYVLNKFN